jgi:hypothetical protein
MPLTINDFNFHNLTRAEAAQMDAELNSDYPNLRKVPKSSNASATFFQDHWILLGGLSVLVYSTWVGHNRFVIDARDRYFASL